MLAQSRFWSAVLSACLVLTALPRDGAAQDVYEDLVLEAIRAHEQGDYHMAHALFERAYHHFPNARAVRGMGIASFEAGRFARAVRELTAALDHSAKPLDPPLRALTEALRTRARTQVGVVHLQLLPADAAVTTADGESASSGKDLLLDAGQHRLRATAAGHEEVNMEVEIAAGTERTLGIVMTPKAEAPRPPELPRGMPSSIVARTSDTPDPPRDSRRRRRVRAATALIALAAGAGLAGGAVSLTGASRVEKIAQACSLGESSRCDPAERRYQLERANIQTLERTSGGLLGVAGALAAGAVGVLVRHLIQGRRAGAMKLALGSRQ